MVKKLIKGLSKGTIGIDLSFFDENKDGKTTWQEIKKAPLDKWIEFAISTGTSIAAVLFLL